MDLTQLLLDTDVTLAMAVIVALLSVTVTGAWLLIKWAARSHLPPPATPPRDMRTLRGVPLEPSFE